MRDLDFCVPSVLVPASPDSSAAGAPSLVAELLRDVRMPALSQALSRASQRRVLRQPADALMTTWQAWVFADRAGVAIDAVNVAELWAAACGLGPSRDGPRWLIEPAHLHIAKDHLRLGDPRALDYTFDEIRSLVDAVNPTLVDSGWRLLPLEPAMRTHAFLTRVDDLCIGGAAIERAVGDNVAAWQPRGGASDPAAAAAALAWRRCVNEIQMVWFGHPVNEAREARGQAAINTLWLSGNGATGSPLPRYAGADSSLPLLAALPIDPDAPRTLETFDECIAPARDEQWGVWRDALIALDARIDDLLRRQSARELGTVTLAFCGRDRTNVATLTAADSRSAWRRLFRTRRAPSLENWFDEAGTV